MSRTCRSQSGSNWINSLNCVGRTARDCRRAAKNTVLGSIRLRDVVCLHLAHTVALLHYLQGRDIPSKCSNWREWGGRCANLFTRISIGLWVWDESEFSVHCNDISWINVQCCWWCRWNFRLRIFSFRYIHFKSSTQWDLFL